MVSADSSKDKGADAPAGRDFRLLVATIRDYAIYMLDPQCRVATWNAGAARMKGYSAEEVIGQHFSVFYTPEDVDADLPMQAIAQALMQGRHESEGWRVRKDGSRFWASAVLTTLYDDNRNIVGFAKVTRDLTERRQAEDDRLRLVKTEEALRLRDEFLSIASHELRTPLNALSLYLQSTKRLGDEGKIPALRASLDKAMGQVERMRELLEGLLDASRIAEGTLTLKREPLNLVSAVAEAIDDVTGVARQAGSEIQVRSHVEAANGRFDRMRLTQLFTNLLQNAIKYGRSQPIEVEISAAGDEAAVAVRDHGIGIKKEDLERIFTRFERAVSARHFGGLGLGLYIAQSIVDAHRGTLSVESTVGQGSTFTVRLPVLEVVPLPAGEPWEASKATS